MNRKIDDIDDEFISDVSKKRKIDAGLSGKNSLHVLTNLAKLI